MRSEGKILGCINFLWGYTQIIMLRLGIIFCPKIHYLQLDRAYQLVVQDERVRLSRIVSEDKPTDAVGFAIRMSAGHGRSQSTAHHRDKPDKSHLHCTHCKKSGHLISRCFELIGYPDWWPNLSKVQGNAAGRGNRTTTTGKGRGSNSARANATNSSSGFTSQPPKGANSQQPPSQVFTPEQWKILAGFIGNTKVSDERLTGEFIVLRGSSIPVLHGM